MFSVRERFAILGPMSRTEQREWRRHVSECAAIARRFLVIVALGFWLGGFTFYAGVVIHTGHRVFGGMRETGFLTQQVTGWLNVSGVAALAILLWNAIACWKAPDRWVRGGLWLTWVLMTGVQVGLFALHPVLDGMLDVEGHRILDRAEFHRV